MSNAKSPIAAETRQEAQEDRSAATRDKLLDAAYRILRDLGHAGLRTANVCLEAGVSRGGLLHHYPTKEILIAAVFERIVQEAEEKSGRRIDLAADEALLPAIVEDARARFFDDSYKVMLDILVASGKEKPLANIRKDLALRYLPTAEEAWAQRLAATGIDVETAEQVTAFLWNMVKGLAIRNLVQRDEKLCNLVIALGLDLARGRCGEDAACASPAA